MHISRLERFATVDSTQRVVREWLAAGVPPVCVAVADEQTAGRGRLDRRWIAPPGAALLISAGFASENLTPRHGWRLAAVVALAMARAGESVAGLPEGTLRLKWPNDIVAVAADRDEALLKVAGVLGEVVADGDRVASAVVGIGTNVDWAAADFPPDLAPSMTSLRELAGGRTVDAEALLQTWLVHLGPLVDALESSIFDGAAWSDRQVTTGHCVEIELGDRHLEGLAVGVDPDEGSLLVKVEGKQQAIGWGEVTRCRVVR